MDADTKSKIEAHIRKHRKSGGRAESPASGDDLAKKDIEDKPADRSSPNNIAKEAEAMKAKKGGRVKRAFGGKAKEAKCEGGMAHHHAGRKARASGGSCESSPFTAARKVSQPAGRSVMSVSEGGND